MRRCLQQLVCLSLLAVIHCVRCTRLPTWAMTQDTIATIAGALAGALRGFDRVPQDLYEQVACVNDLDLDKIAADLVEVVKLKRKG